MGSRRIFCNSHGARMSVEPCYARMSKQKLAVLLAGAFRKLKIRDEHQELRTYADPFCVAVGGMQSVVAIRRVGDNFTSWVHTFGVDAVTGNVTLNGKSDRGLWTAAVDKCTRIDNYAGAVCAIVLFMKSVPPETDAQRRMRNLFSDIHMQMNFNTGTITEAQP